MPANPYEDEAKRQAQIAQLGQPPVSSTMPIGGAPKVSLVNAPAQPGWDAGNWADPNMHSVKYDTERLLYGKNKPSEVGEGVKSAAFQQRFPGATFNGKDWIDFQGILSDGERGSPVHGIDFLKGANPETDTSEGHWWGAPDDPADVTAGGQQAPGIDPRTAVSADNSALAKIMAELSAASQDEPSPAEREALLALLQGGI